MAVRVKVKYLRSVISSLVIFVITLTDIRAQGSYMYRYEDDPPWYRICTLSPRVCYHVFPDYPDTYQNALDACDYGGAHLVFLETQQEEDALNSLLDETFGGRLEYWLGMDRSQSGDWHWHDPSRVTQTDVTRFNWGGDSSLENVFMNAELKWESADEYEDYYIVCEEPATELSSRTLGPTLQGQSVVARTTRISSMFTSLRPSPEVSTFPQTPHEESAVSTTGPRTFGTKSTEPRRTRTPATVTQLEPRASAPAHTYHERRLHCAQTSEPQVIRFRKLSEGRYRRSKTVISRSVFACSVLCNMDPLCSAMAYEKQSRVCSTLCSVVNTSHPITDCGLVSCYRMYC